VSVPSTGFKVTKGKVKPGWDGEGEITEGQQRGPRMKINKGKWEVEEAAWDKELHDFPFSHGKEAM